MDKLRNPNRNIISRKIIVPLLFVAAHILAACGGGGGESSPTARATWDGCKNVTPRAPFVVSAAEATQAMKSLAANNTDASCVATLMPIVAATPSH